MVEKIAEHDQLNFFIPQSQHVQESCPDNMGKKPP